jgi:hypothetical protein
MIQRKRKEKESIDGPRRNREKENEYVCVRKKEGARERENIVLINVLNNRLQPTLQVYSPITTVNKFE